MDQITMTALSEYPAYKAGEETTTHGVFHLVAPKYQGEEAERGSLDIVAVVDVSGSMSGTKIELAKVTVDFLIDNLTDKDRLSLVTYDSNVKVVLGLTNMTSDNKQKAHDHVKRLVAGSCTNLSGGLFKGIQQLKSRAEGTKASVSSVLLMTDGEANEGLQGDSLLSAAREQCTDSDFSLYTFGYGASHNEALLKDLSEIGSGMYYFIENNDIIPESFGDCLGGLLSVVGQNIKLTIQATNGAKLTKIHTKRGFTLDDDKTTAVINFGDIQAEETKDILFTFTLPATTSTTTTTTTTSTATTSDDDSDTDATDDTDSTTTTTTATNDADGGDVMYVTAKLSYVNAITAEFVNTTTELSVRRPAEITEESDKQRNKEVERQVLRVETAASLEAAMQHAKMGNLELAREAVKAQRSAVCQFEDAYASDLCDDLDECMEGLATTQQYNAMGRYQMASKCQSHAFQRANVAEHSRGHVSYATPCRGVFKSKAKAAKKAPQPQPNTTSAPSVMQQQQQQKKKTGWFW